MAETIFSEELSRKYGVSAGQLKEKGIEVGSAGYFGYKKRIITDNTVQVLRELGYQPPVGRVSEALTPDLINTANVVFAMTRWHIDLVMEVNPQAGQKVFLLGGEKDIDDPIGSDLENYRQVGRQIQTAIMRILMRY